MNPRPLSWILIPLAWAALVASVLMLPGCASQEAYRGYLDSSKRIAEAYYAQKPMVSITCMPSCTFAGLEINAPLAYVGPQQIVNENAGMVASLAGFLSGATGLFKSNGTADIFRAAGEAFKLPQANVTTTTTTNTSTPTTTTSTNTATNTSTTTNTNASTNTTK